MRAQKNAAAAYVAHLLTRKEFLSQLDQLRSHAPAIDAHPFHNAA